VKRAKANVAESSPHGTENASVDQVRVVRQGGDPMRGFLRSSTRVQPDFMNQVNF